MNEQNISETDWWWIAINQASCASAPIGSKKPPKVIPTPEQLVGYQTRQEQLAAQQLLLTEPIERVTEYMETLPSRIESGEVRYIRPKRPGRPTRGATQWIFEGGQARSQEWRGDEDDELYF
ncbi:hypothetical protein FYK55_27340 [Roseiconus nitratireducens]|uniref:Uncharacterized protein n=1 Tax=Roseiconus nitratireducens TaxID=2605748 RepID=A0A5M6CTQ8_9BACT|nr:hypothetical protein [Roseiconus nitratireducens]KAA5538604.1 hypothetical protein FYK55_27340 [Roseiconus nitratireducens]